MKSTRNRVLLAKKTLGPQPQSPPQPSPRNIQHRFMDRDSIVQLLLWDDNMGVGLTLNPKP